MAKMRNVLHEGNERNVNGCAEWAHNKACERERERDKLRNVERMNGHLFRPQFPMSCGDEREVTLRLSTINKPVAR